MCSWAQSILYYLFTFHVSNNFCSVHSSLDFFFFKAHKATVGIPAVQHTEASVLKKKKKKGTKIKGILKFSTGSGLVEVPLVLLVKKNSRWSIFLLTVLYLLVLPVSGHM